jgi:hypothetical protein
MKKIIGAILSWIDERSIWIEDKCEYIIKGEDNYE